MRWQGKVIGALIGLLVGGRAGLFIGLFIGHLIDIQAERSASAPRATTRSVQEAFFRATFQVMGHIAKSDGRVSEQDIQAARAMMAQFRLSEAEVQRAIELFNDGKRADFPLDASLAELHRLCSNRPDLCRMFVQIQLQTTLWSDGLHLEARKLLARVCALLDISAYELVQMEALLRMQQGARRAQTPQVDRVAQAYEVLGIARDASDAEVTKAYRRLMSQNHPDKLHAKGLPESMMKVAEEKTRQIREAYEIIRDTRAQAR